MTTIKRPYQFVITCIISGILFLIPVSIVFILLEKIVRLLQKTLTALHLDLPQRTFWYIFLNNVILILLILAFCFLAGLFFKFKWVKQFVSWLEHNVLQVLPGYDYIKSAVEDAFGITGHKFEEVILYRQDDKFQLGFRVESINTTMVMIFIPGVPKPRSGSILIVPNNRYFYLTYQPSGIFPFTRNRKWRRRQLGLLYQQSLV